MKKLLTFILAIALTLSLAACGKEKSNERKHTVDIESAAKEGMISELGYRLGDDVESTKKAMLTITDEDGEPVDFAENPIGDYTVMEAGDVKCCYKTDDKDAGLTHIIGLGDAFGFFSDTVMTQVRDTLKEMGYEATERDEKDGELFFLPKGDSYDRDGNPVKKTVLEYKIEGNTVLFVFTYGDLSATVIQK